MVEAEGYLEYGCFQGGSLDCRRFSRQALQPRPAIYRAYVETKKRLRQGLPMAKRRPLAERIAALQGENSKLREAKQRLLETQVTWQLNAESFGLLVHQLNEGLPTARLPSDIRQREQRRREERKKKLLERRERQQAYQRDRGGRGM
jgi:hypothetical protein